MNHKSEDEVRTQPTPKKVKEAIRVLAEYLSDGGWEEVIVYNSGSAHFLLLLTILIPRSSPLRAKSV